MFVTQEKQSLQVGHKTIFFGGENYKEGKKNVIVVVVPIT